MLKTILPPLINAGSSLVGAGLQQAFGRSNMKKQQEIAQENMQYQWDKQIPSVVNSMRQAGLNVGLMYSNGGPSVGSSTGSVSAPQIGNPFTGLGELTLATQKAKADIDNTNANTKLQEQQTINARLEQTRREIENLLKQKELDKWNEEYEARLKVLYAEEKNLIAQSDKLIAETETENQTRDGKVQNLSADVREKDSRVRLNDAQRKQIIDTLPFDIKLKQAIEQRELTQADVNRMLDDYYKAGADKFSAEQRNIIADAVSQELENAYYEKTGYKPASGVNAILNEMMRAAFGEKPADRVLTGTPNGRVRELIKQVGNIISLVDDQHLKLYLQTMYDKLKESNKNNNNGVSIPVTAPLNRYMH